MANRLRMIKPDVFLGQKFSIVGPNLASYQNFLTGFVGVENSQIVREKMVNNRLLYGKYTPFMEVVAINPREKAEDVARKLQAVLFGNPYLSFYVSTLPQDSKQTIRFWLDYWKRNYKVIFDGTFEPFQVSQFYPVIKVENEEKTIYALYSDYTLNLPISLNTPIDVINSKTTETMRFLLSKPGVQYNYEIYDCKGVQQGKGVIMSKAKNSFDILVPSAGFIRISRFNP
jgi:hypothetical protein